MNLNCKLSFTDEQRNRIKQHLTGKPVKALATRAEICQLINDLLEAFTEPYVHVERKRDVATFEEDMEVIIDEGVNNACTEDCCRANELLRTRINTLQHRLDRMVAK